MTTSLSSPELWPKVGDLVGFFSHLPAPRAAPPDRHFFFFSLASLVTGCCFQSEIYRTTSNGGPLGSCIDEERSKLRYLV